MHVLILGIPTAADHTMRVDLASQMPLRFISRKSTKGFAWGSTEAVWENQGTCGKSCWILVLLQHLPQTKFLCSPRPRPHHAARGPSPGDPAAVCKCYLHTDPHAHALSPLNTAISSLIKSSYRSPPFPLPPNSCTPHAPISEPTLGSDIISLPRYEY